MYRVRYVVLIVIVILIVSLITITGCSNKNISDESKDEVKQPNKVKTKQDNKGDNSNKKDINKEQEQVNKKPEPVKVDYNEIKPNELGEIMILMYHTFSDKETNVYVRSFDNFKKDLEYFYNNKYRLISLKDFLNKNIDVPAGYTPLVMTFDDGATSQFKLKKVNDQYELDPECAVGILKDFYEKHPGFGFEATFFLNEGAFSNSPGSEKEKIEFLMELGLDIGNHTYGHVNLGRASVNEIKEAIGKQAKRLNEFFPDKDLNINMLALPEGSYSDKTLEHVITGEYDGIRYKNEGIFLVGWKPSPPPWHVNFNQHKIVRVRASEGEDFDMGYHIKQIEENPNLKYVSDGRKDVICFPEASKDRLNKENLNNLKVDMY